MTDLKANTDVVDHLGKAADALLERPVQDVKSSRIRISLGRCLIDLGDPYRASNLADQVLASSPKHRGATFLKIDATIEAGHTTEALDQIDAGRAQFLSEAEFLRKKILALKRGGKMADVIPFLEILQQNDPQNADLLVELGHAHVTHGSPLDAENSFLRALNIDKKNVEAWQSRIDLANKQADPVTACEIADQALATLPDVPVLVERAARARIVVGRLEDARQLLEDTLEKMKSPSPSINLSLALVLRRLGEFDASEQLHERILADNPRNVSAWLSRVQTALEQGDIDRALVVCTEALGNCPEARNLKRQRAEILGRAGHEEKALETLEAILSRQPDHVPTALALARAFRLAGRVDEADRQYTKILETDPSNWAALQGRVAIAESRGDLEMAMKLLEEG